MESWEGARGVGVSGGREAEVIVGGGSSERPFFNERMVGWDGVEVWVVGFVGVEATRTGTAVLAEVVADVDVNGGGVVEEVLDVAVRLEEVGLVVVGVVGLARFTAAAFDVVGFVYLRRP